MRTSTGILLHNRQCCGTHIGTHVGQRQGYGYELGWQWMHIHIPPVLLGPMGF